MARLAVGDARYLGVFLFSFLVEFWILLRQSNGEGYSFV